MTELKFCLGKALTFSSALSSFWKPNLIWDQHAETTIGRAHISSSLLPIQLTSASGASGPNIFYFPKGLPRPGIMIPTGDINPHWKPFWSLSSPWDPAALMASSLPKLWMRLPVWNYAWTAHTALCSSGSNLEAEAIDLNQYCPWLWVHCVFWIPLL